MKLQSQIDYEDSIDVPSLSDSDFRRLSGNHRKFLKQPLELCMFVPCDEDGNVLEKLSHEKFKDSNWVIWAKDYLEYEKKYQQAKERVLFDGFKIIKPNEHKIDSLNGTSFLQNEEENVGFIKDWEDTWYFEYETINQ